jgi:hypothetical protein
MGKHNPLIPIGAVTCIPQALVYDRIFASTTVLREETALDQYTSVIGATVRR